MARLVRHAIRRTDDGQQFALLQREGNQSAQERAFYYGFAAGIVLFCVNSKPSACRFVLPFFRLCFFWLLLVAVAVRQKEKSRPCAPTLSTPATSQPS